MCVNLRLYTTRVILRNPKNNQKLLTHMRQRKIIDADTRTYTFQIYYFTCSLDNLI